MLKDEIQVIYAMLGDTAGLDPVQDSALRGRIQATKAVIEVTYSDISGESE